MNIGIFGFGAAGKRYLSILQNEHGLDIESIQVISSRYKELMQSDSALKVDFTDRLRGEFGPSDLVIVASATELHESHLDQLFNHRTNILIEKPVTGRARTYYDYLHLLSEKTSSFRTGYMWRRHPAIQLMRQFFTDGSYGALLSYRASWSEYVGYWHPDEDHTKSYSTRKDTGGPLKTLSHIIDTMIYIVGKDNLESNVKCLKHDAQSSLTAGIDSETSVDIICSLSNGGSINLHADYFGIPTENSINLQFEAAHFYLDLNTDTHKVFTNGKAELLNTKMERLDLFRVLLLDFISDIENRNYHSDPLSDLLLLGDFMFFDSR